jgi:hypothetical protein
MAVWREGTTGPFGEAVDTMRKSVAHIPQRSQPQQPWS